MGYRISLMCFGLGILAAVGCSNSADQEDVSWEFDESVGLVAYPQSGVSSTKPTPSNAESVVFADPEIVAEDVVEAEPALEPELMVQQPRSATPYLDKSNSDVEPSQSLETFLNESMDKTNELGSIRSLPAWVDKEPENPNHPWLDNFEPSVPKIDNQIAESDTSTDPEAHSVQGLNPPAKQLVSGFDRDGVEPTDVESVDQDERFGVDADENLELTSLTNPGRNVGDLVPEHRVAEIESSEEFLDEDDLGLPAVADVLGNAKPLSREKLEDEFDSTIELDSNLEDVSAEAFVAKSIERNPASESGSFSLDSRNSILNLESSDEDDASPSVANNSGLLSDRSDKGEDHSPVDYGSLKSRTQTALAYYYQRPLNVAEHSPWSLMHGVLAYGSDTEISVNVRRENALDWLLQNGAGKGMRLLTIQNGNLFPKQGAGYQGHPGQLLAILAQAGVAAEETIRVGRLNFTVQDLIDYEKKSCEPATELTFKLIGLSCYLDTNDQWENQFGKWSLERLLQEELKQPVKSGAACGGTHRLTGFSYALHYHMNDGEPLVGAWKAARDFVDIHIETAFDLQNSDGSFSTNWFRGRGMADDQNQRLWTTGHILEWLMFALPESEKSGPRLEKAMDYLVDLLLEYRDYKWDVGKQYHALHAIAMYDVANFGRKTGGRDFEYVTAQLPQTKPTARKSVEENNSRPQPRPLLFRRRIFGR